MSRLETWWQEIHDSLWFLPAVLTVCAFGLALLAVRVDQQAVIERAPGYWWIFGGGAEGARGVLGTIAGSLITVTGVVFSITIVALQLASSQFTPRVLRYFTADRANQVVLGVFIGTFAFALVVLRSVRSPAGGVAGFVPAISVTIALLLAVISIGFLIFFINHAARSIQASHIIDRVANETLEHVAMIFPRGVGEAVPERRVEPVVLETGAGVPIPSADGGYLQAVDEDGLAELAGEHGLVLRMAPAIGDFLLPGQLLAWAWPEHAVDADRRAAVRRAFVLGPERTPYQDVEFGIIGLMDIAVKALSPTINDPTTAMVCIDRLGQILHAIGSREPPSRFRVGADGKLMLVARRTTFARAADLAVDQILHYGASNPAIALRLIEMLASVAALVPADHRTPLAAKMEDVLHAARIAIRDPAESAFFERAAGPLIERFTGRAAIGHPPARRAG